VIDASVLLVMRAVFALRAQLSALPSATDPVVQEA
jgi:hypothetical protein